VRSRKRVSNGSHGLLSPDIVCAFAIDSNRHSDPGTHRHNPRTRIISFGNLLVSPVIFSLLPRPVYEVYPRDVALES
jgi:hypothetical protein